MGIFVSPQVKVTSLNLTGAEALWVKARFIGQSPQPPALEKYFLGKCDTAREQADDAQKTYKRFFRALCDCGPTNPEQTFKLNINILHDVFSVFFPHKGKVDASLMGLLHVCTIEMHKASEAYAYMGDYKMALT